MAKSRAYQTRSDILSDYYKLPHSKAQAIADYKKLVSLANNRMYALEKAAESNQDFESISRYAYKRAVHDLHGQSRFMSVNKIEDLPFQSVNKRLMDMRRFLRSKTSTVSGTKQVWKANTLRFNKKYGTHMTQSELAKFFDKESGLYEKLKNSTDWGSETIMQTIAEVRKNKSDILDKLDSMSAAHEERPESVTDLRVQELIEQYPEEVREWLNG